MTFKQWSLILEVVKEQQAAVKAKKEEACRREKELYMMIEDTETSAQEQELLAHLEMVKIEKEHLIYKLEELIQIEGQIANMEVLSQKEYVSGRR